MGYYDLYGNSYKTSQEALNAEMTQCAEIDARAADERISKLEEQQENKYEVDQRDKKIDYLIEEVAFLRKEVEELKKQVGV